MVKKILLYLKRKWIPALYLTIVFMSSVLIHLTGVSNENVKFDTDRELYFQNDWIYELPNGETGKVVLPKIIKTEDDSDRSKEMTIRNVLPTIDAPVSLFYFSRHTGTRVYVDGELRYDTKDILGNVQTWFHVKGAFYCEIPLTPEDSEKEVTIGIYDYGKRYYGCFGDVFVGDRGSFFVKEIKGNVPNIIGYICLLLLGVILFVLWGILTFVTKAKYNECLCLAFFSVCLGFWLGTESGFSQFFFRNAQMYTVLAYEMLLLIPMPLVLYFTYGARPKRTKMFGKIGTVALMNTWLWVHLLHFFTSFDMGRSLIVSQITIFIAAIYVLFVQLDETLYYFRHRNHERSLFFVVPLIGIGVMAPITIVELIFYVTGTGVNVSVGLSFGVVCYIGALAIDSSLKMVSENEKIQRASESKSLFLANMSHEIRTPLNAILGFDELLLREAKDENTREYALKIQTAGTMLKNIINSVLDISKIESGRLEIYSQPYKTTDLLDGLLNNVRSQADKKNLEVLSEIDEKLPAVLIGDENHLREVLMNILSNAVKYTPSGSVRLTVRLMEHNGMARKAKIYFSVKDTGIGIRQSDMEKLFQKFERLDSEKNYNIEGTGLGMNIVSSLLVAMGSVIEVDSVYGEGSDFHFVLEQGYEGDEVIGNYEEGESLKRQESGTIHNFVAPNAHVLVVDDVPLNLQVATGLLSPLEMQIDTAESGKEAIEKVLKNSYDLVLMDHMMPEMDGIEATRRIRSMAEERNNSYLKNLPILALTANAIAGMRETFLSQGMQDFISKPVESDELMLAIRRWLPKDKVKRLSQQEIEKSLQEKQEEDAKKEDAFSIEIPGIDMEVAKKFSNDFAMFESNLKGYYEGISATKEKINRFVALEDRENYTITVHGLKSASKILGAMEVSEKARMLEDGAHAGDFPAVWEKTPELLELFEALEESLREYLQENLSKQVAEKISMEDFHEMLAEIKEAAEGFDMDALMVFEETLGHLEVEPSDEEIKEKVKELVRNVSFMELSEYLGEIIG